MLKAKIRDVLISQILSSIFHEISEVAEKIKERRKQTYHQVMILRNNYYKDIMTKLKKIQVLANKSLTFRTKSKKKRNIRFK